MTLAEISNIRLSQSIKVDASLVSRYRSGIRMPKAGSEIVDQLGDAIWKRIIQLERKRDLAKLMAVPQEILDEELFFGWLFDYVSDHDRSISDAEKFLASFETYREITELPDWEELVKPEIYSDTRDIYRGITGLQCAVLRFLSNVIRENATELMLYSDQNMDWMVGDPTFRMQWAVLMSECVKRGVRIRIIHNIDRNVDEMNSAIRSWLPLYMSGMIEPYYCKKDKDARFSHTMFLCPGYGAIEAVHVVGMEREGIYHYFTDEEHLSFFKEEYLGLLELAKPLITFSATETPKQFFAGITVQRGDKEEKIPSVETDQSFKNIHILVTDQYVMITHVKNPGLAFKFWHPLMCRAFAAYASYISRISGGV